VQSWITKRQYENTLWTKIEGCVQLQWYPLPILELFHGKDVQLHQQLYRARDELHRGVQVVGNNLDFLVLLDAPEEPFEGY
jgi:hypothetical protein